MRKVLRHIQYGCRVTRVNVYFLPGFTAMHWLQTIATFQIFLNFRNSQIQLINYFVWLFLRRNGA